MDISFAGFLSHAIIKDIKDINVVVQEEYDNIKGQIKYKLGQIRDKTEKMNEQKHKRLLFIVRKSEKLTAAVYMLTDFFDDKESLKWKLREESISFLSFINTTVSLRKYPHVLDKLQSLLERIRVLLELGRGARLVSPMNLAILKEEYRLLGGALRKEWEQEEPFRDFEFPEKFFSGDYAPTLSDLLEKGKGDGLKVADVRGTEQRHTDDTQKNTEFSRELSGFYGESFAHQEKELRRETILKILRAKGKVTIKDISRLVKEVSEKTIQRELTMLMEEGIVAREGKRRWSKYVLKNEAQTTERISRF
ncbi:MAG: hypothetical protein A3J08_00280 [Candidatus Lloydbacteria bacterium RIFCSPLOWO2_02_FULL_51_11]|uniref:HTH deoR-type domain-containing protein n=1 Tax=Candidatus Lloydbacteria bacterium RIFCSPLOWO2_02_FULL_51_11 TaxID=1798667 RepID=A0A1G2DRP0_9BACT|nr:MAG: hypothetical protein A3J08_00280 [Candidatus Lloydbacteria bacterium RIFCSPLOWO2_02_FULL_51_11]